MCNTIREVLWARPASAPGYAWRTVLFMCNFLFWNLLSCRRIRVGRNLHVLSPLCFQAERPAARVSVGDDFVAYRDIRICAWGAGHVFVGNVCSIGSGTRIHARFSITLGNHVLVSWDVLIMDFDGHSLDYAKRMVELDRVGSRLWPRFDRRVKKESRQSELPAFDARPIVIEDNVWIGARAILLKGVTIGAGSVVAAGAVVAHDVPARSVVVGNPAKVTRMLQTVG